MGLQVAIVAGILGIGVLLFGQSRKGPRNAFELDERAGQLRIGYRNRHGAFVRQRVVPLKLIEGAGQAPDADGKPELNIILSGEEIRVSLIDAKPERLDQISAKIRAAADTARQGPRNSRIDRGVASVSASYREISRRVTSRMMN